MAKKETGIYRDEKIGFRERMSYTFGGGGVNMSLAVLGLLLTYYTMVLGIPAGLATMVIGVSKVFDGISDLVMGWIVDNTDSKYGKARPWILRMALPTVIAVVASFMVPAGWNEKAQIVYMFVTYNLSSTICITALAVPFNSLNGYMTTNQQARGINGGFVMVMNAITNTVVTGTYLILARTFGDGEVYSRQGWSVTMLIYAVIFFVMLMICFFGTKERMTDSETTAKKRRGSNVSVGKSVLSLVKNRYWLICIISIMAVYILSALLAQSMVYFAQFVLMDVDQQAALTISMSLAMIPAAILSIFLMTKYGKRNMMCSGMFIFAAASLLPILDMNAVVCAVSMSIKGAGLGLAAAPCSSLVLDALTYGEWKNGFSNMGLGNAAYSFSMKLGTSLGTVLLGVLLESSGFISGADVQPDSAVSMIKTIFIWVPFIFAAVTAVILLFYDLDKIYPRIAADLKEGRYAPGVQANGKTENPEDSE